ncbi:histidinol-phosphatase HisJ family protein [Fusobacterium polymorphum]|uniref:histidinol-phosphatase HisJ family protein n=1 Tax=Fusobacterium nucleatum subsp. polymorphum TaxID=76857 RepID=UPI002B4BBDBA|nr:histidinol-phosphatase HisJ family protein [Fusobacterium polymorphum]WRL77186.1 histidinol-phosphatase HisJ family protein [Fusobacterium polymorphum]
MFDQHVHSSFSFDSNEDLENYINVSNNSDIITTEHLDFENPIINYKDSSIDYLKYVGQIKNLNKKYSNKFFLGIEIGYTPNSEKRIEDFLKDKNFNLKLLSIHQNGNYDYMCVNKKLISLEVLIQEYFEQMIQALESSIEFNVLAHFEYGLRMIDISVIEFDNLASVFLNKIIELIVKKEIAFEVNTKSMYKYKKENLYSYMIEKYLKKGGKLFTLGSDAHNIKDYAYKFDEAKKFLLSKNIKEVILFKDKVIMQKLLI